jgi:hypothetical protein
MTASRTKIETPSLDIAAGALRANALRRRILDLAGPPALGCDRLNSVFSPYQVHQRRLDFGQFLP